VVQQAVHEQHIAMLCSSGLRQQLLLKASLHIRCIDVQANSPTDLCAAERVAIVQAGFRSDVKWSTDMQ